MGESLIRRWNHRRLDWMRAQKLRLMKSFFDSTLRRRPVQQSSGEIKEILVLRLDDKLGDGITATGFLRELKKAFPQACLRVVAGPSTGQIYQQQSSVDQIDLTKKGLIPTLKLFLQLRKKNYDVIINTSHIMNPRTIFLMSQLRAFRKVGFRCHDYQLFTDHVDYDPCQDHVTTRYQNVLPILGTAPTREGLKYEIVIPQSFRERAKELLSRYQNQKIVILNSYAGARLRSLNEATSSNIVRGLLQKDPRLVVVSIGNQNDLPVIEKWVERAREPRWVVFPGESEFFLNCALIEQAQVVISPDTAIVHVASALGRAQVAIFREDSKVPGDEQNSKIWAPLSWGAQARVQIVYSCSLPRSSARVDEEADINDVNVDSVVNAAIALLCG